MNHWYWKKRKQRQSQFLSAASSMTVALTSSPFAVSAPPVEKSKPKDMGLAIEPILGVRTFNVSTDDGIGLHSMNGVYWPPYEPLAGFCLNSPFTDHEVPHLDCMCGIYAWKWEDWTKNQNNILWGEVYLWGEVIICELGYRAEFAYPKSLHINAKPTRAVQRIRDGLAETYGVPVTLTDPKQPPAIQEAASTSYYQWGVTGATGPTIPYMYYPLGANPPYGGSTNP